MSPSMPFPLLTTLCCHAETLDGMHKAGVEAQKPTERLVQAASQAQDITQQNATSYTPNYIGLVAIDKIR